MGTFQGVRNGMKAAVTCSAREKILATARELFYLEGIRAVGVDTIVRRSGVTKMTLYRYFPSKDELIVAYIEESIADFWQWFESVVGRHAGNPRRQLEEYFDALGERVSGRQVRGCASLNVKTEFSDPEHPARKVVARHKEELRRRLRVMLGEAGARQPEALADALLLLINGAYSSVGLYQEFDMTRTVRQAARTLLDASLPALR